MTEMANDQDPYIGLQAIEEYYLKEKVGQGRIGSVYKAERSDTPRDVLACKVISSKKLKHGWERELEKVVLLRTVPNVVQYHQHGSKLDKNKKPFVWILWDYIPSINLKKYSETVPWPLDIAFIETIVKTVLQVLHACSTVGIQHGDLHEGNVLISDPDSRLPGSPRRIWISDFGYGGSHNEFEPKDDFRQLFSITSNLLHKLNPSNLNPRDRVMHQKIDEFLRKKVLEFDHTQGKYVGDPTSLLEDFTMLGSAAELESAAATKGEELKGPGDYLVAEALGYRVDEWKNLFVPEFLAAQDLLSRNITVLTGARGCGKTMSFRRLTLYMDRVIGEPSAVRGADQFIGFYLNCRDLVEAFPWLPRRLNKGMQQQIIHYFHLAWLSEICKTLSICDPDGTGVYKWLDELLSATFDGRYNSLPQGANILSHARAFVENEKEGCRLSNLGEKSDFESWPLARLDFLDVIQSKIESHVPWIAEKPLYLFLDDYTIPIVTREVQRVLNPIIFKRRSKLFFKISTEAANSFDTEGLHRKPLELHQDFELIDLATESLHQADKDKTELLDKIFKPRIDRHSLFKGKGLGLRSVLGKMPLSNNDLARQMRDTVQKGSSKRVLYHGAETFVGMWASDIRIMIQMFTDMLRDANSALAKDELPIPRDIQNKIYKATGGEVLEFIRSVVTPSLWERRSSSTKPGEKYGTHLKDIVEAFVNVSRYELTEGNLVSNQGRLNPKQAFRLEIIDKFEMPAEAMRFLDGLVRWHIFLQDWRGKSVRGMITPRLYMNRGLIPFCNLTFSSHDSIHLTNEEFARLLTYPKEFLKFWQEKRAKKMRDSAKGPTLFDMVQKGAVKT